MPTSISVELVPRDEHTLLCDAETAAKYKEVTHINIPDLLHRPGFTPLRSVDAIRLIKERFGDRFRYVAHGRAFDESFGVDVCRSDIALVVGGDKPPESEGDAMTSLGRIEKLSKEMRVMAALDPYRSSPKAELEYMEAKRKAGAKGFFTQPFFSVTHARYWESIIPKDLEIFLGISPVTTLASIKYWQEKNMVIFPRDFSATERGQIKLARNLIDLAEKKGRSVYLMPIRMPLAPFLQSVFG